jgi:hypothetical protein
MLVVSESTCLNGELRVTIQTNLWIKTGNQSSNQNGEVGMMRKVNLTAALFSTVFMAASIARPQAHATNFIVNGSFEADFFTGSGHGYRLGLVSNDITGWCNQWLVLGEAGSQTDTIQQPTAGLAVGNIYNRTFRSEERRVGKEC